MILRVIFGAAALALGSSLSLAADLPVKAPAAASVGKAPGLFNWTGFYAGGQIGYSWTDASFIDTDIGTGSSYSVDGVTGGGHLGLLWQAPSSPVVWGIEGDISANGAKGDDAGFGGLVDETKIRWTASARGIVGVSAGNTLWYATGGAAWAKVHTRDVGGPWENHGYTGWTAGAGVSWAVAPNWVLGVLYRYTDYGDEITTSIPGPLELKTHEVVARASFKFATGGKTPAPVVTKY